MRLSILRFVSLAACATIIALAGTLPARAQSDRSAILHLIDKSKTTDAACRDALTQVERKLSIVEDYSCRMKSSLKTSDGESVSYVEQTYKRPNLLSGVTTRDGGEIQSISDGKSYWQLVRNEPGSGSKMLARLAFADKMTDDQKRDFIERHERPKVIRYSLSRMEREDCPPEEALGFGQIIRPFASLDMATVSLENDDDDAYVFTGQAKGQTARVRLRIRKRDGVMDKMEHLSEAGAAIAVMEVSDVQINTKPDARKFSFAPPIGVEVIDSTDGMIAGYRALHPKEQRSIRAAAEAAPAVKGSGILIKPSAPKESKADKGKGREQAGGGKARGGEARKGRSDNDGGKKGGGNGGGKKGGGKKRGGKR